MKKKRNAFEAETAAAADARLLGGAPPSPAGEAMAMLARRGLRPEQAPGDVPFPAPWDGRMAECFSQWLGHYAFRLFLRGAIQRSRGFLPAETTRYLTSSQAKAYAEILADLGLAEKMARGRYRLLYPARSFGGTLEWYIGRELARRYGCDVATGVQLHARGSGGDLDVVAAAEGKLIYVEAKSSPPRNLAAPEMGAFWGRLRLLHPDVALFAVDTALRLSDKVIPLLAHAYLRQEGCGLNPRCLGGQIWALTPHVYAVNGSRDLMANIGKALAAGLRALSPRWNA